MRTVLVPAVAGLFSAVGLLFARPEFHEVRTCHLDVRCRRSGRGRQRSSPRWRRKLAGALAGRARSSGCGRPTSATAAELGGRGRLPGRRDRHRRARGAASASRTSTSGSTASRTRRARRSRSGRCGSRRSGRRAPTTRLLPAQRTRPARRRPSRGSTSAATAGGAGAAAVVDRRRARARAAARRRVRHHGRRPAAAGRSGATQPPGRSCWSVTWRLATRVDPITLQIVGNALASMADEMATTICRTAHSTVVRDGMDFSAVVCDAEGRDRRAGGQRAVPPRLDPGRDGDAARELRRAGSGRATSS